MVRARRQGSVAAQAELEIEAAWRAAKQPGAGVWCCGPHLRSALGETLTVVARAIADAVLE
jgi:hypothetical protein